MQYTAHPPPPAPLPPQHGAAQQEGKLVLQQDVSGRPHAVECAAKPGIQVPLLQGGRTGQAGIKIALFLGGQAGIEGGMFRSSEG